MRAILALPAIAGKFGVRGGGMTMSLSRAFPVNSSRLARPELREGAPRQVNMTQLGRLLTEPQHPAVRALFVYNANPVAMTPDQNRVLAGLANEELFTVVHDQVMTDTAALCRRVVARDDDLRAGRSFAQVVRALLSCNTPMRSFHRWGNR